MSAASTTAGFQQSKDNLAKAAKQLAANAWPIVDPDLPASRLRIDPARARLLPGGSGRGAVGRVSSVTAMNYSRRGGECSAEATMIAQYTLRNLSLPEHRRPVRGLGRRHDRLYLQGCHTRRYTDPVRPSGSARAFCSAQGAVVKA